MNVSLNQILIAVCAAALSGIGTAIINNIKDAKKEKTRQLERYQDQLKLDLKDLKIELYKLEKELSEWKDKYYEAIEQIIEVRSELEQAMLQISVLENTVDLDK